MSKFDQLFSKIDRRLALVILIVMTFCAGWYGHKYSTYKQGDAYTHLTKIARGSSVPYSFTSPLLYIDNAGVTFSELDPLKAKMQGYVSKAVANGEADEVSVYFRDLNTSRWTGIKEDSQYDPASMQKVVLLIAYLRSAENDPSILTRKLYYNGDTDKDSYYQAAHYLRKGNYYSVQDLLVDMITKSGNDSTQALFDNIDKVELAKVYKDLEFPMPAKDSVETISSIMYSRLFRVLYGATYLSADLSENILRLLSQTEFNKGLKAPLPVDLAVSHKFGERTANVNGQEERQLHDCGIIYYPSHPYFLCVMTKGADFADLEGVIAGISDLTYKYWNSEW